MATSPDHPELRYVQASGFTRGRPDGRPLWIVVHDMEAGESSTRAESTAAYFASGSGGRSVSAHYCVDDDSVIQCVRLADSAWTVGNRPGNNRGINWEFSGFARQTRAEWLDVFSQAMFHQAAPIIRADAERFGIPLRKCSVADLRAFRPGVTSHNDLRLAFGQTTHTDPGPNFPWDVFMDILLTGDDMPITDADAHKIALAVMGLSYGKDERRRTVATILQETRAFAKAAALDMLEDSELAAISEAASAGVLASADELAAAVVANLPAGALTKDDVEAAVRAAFERGLAPDA